MMLLLNRKINPNILFFIGFSMKGAISPSKAMYVARELYEMDCFEIRSRELHEMDCFENSLDDTIGISTLINI